MYRILPSKFFSFSLYKKISRSSSGYSYNNISDINKFIFCIINNMKGKVCYLDIYIFFFSISWGVPIYKLLCSIVNEKIIRFITTIFVTLINVFPDFCFLFLFFFLINTVLLVIFFFFLRLSLKSLQRDFHPDLKKLIIIVLTVKLFLDFSFHPFSCVLYMSCLWNRRLVTQPPLKNIFKKNNDWVDCKIGFPYASLYFCYRIN